MFIRYRNEPYLPLPSQPKLVLIYRPRRDGRLSWPWVAGWLHTEINVRHRELNPTPSPISVPFQGGESFLTLLLRAEYANHWRLTTDLLWILDVARFRTRATQSRLGLKIDANFHTFYPYKIREG